MPEVFHVRPEEFDHGGTRHLAIQRSDADVFVCMTQDAVPADKDLIGNLLGMLYSEDHVAAVCARQLPMPDCGIIERYTRQFNYPDKSRMKWEKDLKTMGIKTFFCSNVCAAYRRDIYDRMGGFLQAIREAGLSEECVRVVPGAQVEAALANNTLAELLYPMDYTAIVSFRDEVSYPLMNAIRGKGISIPQDISLISFDNLKAESPALPSLTSIYTDESIAEIGVKMLLERMDDASLPARNVILPVKIFEGGTTAPPSQNINL